jgi:hypothetical protein
MFLFFIFFAKKFIANLSSLNDSYLNFLHKFQLFGIFIYINELLNFIKDVELTTIELTPIKMLISLPCGLCQISNPLASASGVLGLYMCNILTGSCQHLLIIPVSVFTGPF